MYLGTERHLRDCEGHRWRKITRQMKYNSEYHNGCYAVSQHPIKCYHQNETDIFQRSANDTDIDESSEIDTFGKYQYIQ